MNHALLEFGLNLFRAHLGNVRPLKLAEWAAHRRQDQHLGLVLIKFYHGFLPEMCSREIPKFSFWRFNREIQRKSCSQSMLLNICDKAWWCIHLANVIGRGSLW